MTILSSGEAIGRLRADRAILLARVAGLTEEQLGSECLVDSRPLGDFCRSLHDLVAHVLMWDEINLAVLAEAAAGREHWSLDARWEDPAVGRSLNIGGVEAGRHLSPWLLLHRSGAVHDAILEELGRVGEESWDEVGALAQRVWTVPGHPAFWHAAIHLGQAVRGSL
ncbi:hypothetical protein [Nonomuraea soli]|uniref:DinB family protein n=1 Tax=Nonomuraea soli TaxID=1032476 RepID=A0A7W0HW31_9ACTN|nr:hypothetical protein [Nonomuraea soli]MBA2897849.1 hypothetical protein [Nonomuraea soli]